MTSHSSSTTNNENDNHDNVWMKFRNSTLFKRHKFALGVQNDRYIVVAGGFPREFLRSVIMFDTKTFTSKILPDLPEDFDGHGCRGAILEEHRFYVSGYKNSTAYYIDLKPFINIMTSTDTTSTSSSFGWKEVQVDCDVFKHTKLRPVNSNGKGNICVVGGIGFGDNVQCPSYMYNLDDNSKNNIHQNWSEIPPMTVPRSYHATAVVGDQIYAIGGNALDKFGSGRILSSVQVFNKRTGLWKKGPDLPITLMSAATTVFKRFIIVSGGYCDLCERSSSCYVFNTYTQKWSDAIRCHAPRSGHEIMIVEGSLVSVGGFDRDDGKKNLNDIESISLAHLIPNWYIIEDYILIRELLERGRACICDCTDQNLGIEIEAIQKMMIYLNTDTFRHVLSFMIKLPY